MSEIIFSAKLPHNTDYLGISNCTIEFKITNEYVSAPEYVQVFNSFLRAIGLSEYSIMKAELDAALDIETNGSELVDKLMACSEIMEISDHICELTDVEEKQKIQIDRLQSQIISLKAKLSRLEEPDNPQYTDEEMDAMCDY